MSRDAGAYEPLTSTGSSGNEGRSEGDAEKQQQRREEYGSVRGVRLRRLMSWAPTVLLTLSLLYIVRLQVVLHDLKSDVETIPLGADPGGFVPREIGQPLRWTSYDDETDPFFFSLDAFEGIERVRDAVEYFSIRANGKHTTYMGMDDQVRDLPVFVSKKGTEIYHLRVLHQMHCISVIFDDIGHLRNGYHTKWDDEHIIHCINTVRAAVTCLADATPVSFIDGKAHVVTDRQQARCRNYFALREWAQDPVRAVRLINNAKPGEAADWEEI